MINVRIQPTEVKKLSPQIKVIGVGGGGGNAVNNMISSNLEGVEYLVCNTDAQAMSSCMAEAKIQLGVDVTGGLGAGARPEVGQAAAEESLDEIQKYIEDANMAFVTAGMGGGTGTGAAPVIARACRERGILTVGVVTKPFHFEGSHRMKQAEAGIEEMQKYVDTLIVIPNQNLFRIANEKTTFAEAFKMADTVLQSGVRGVTDLMVMPGLINLDFADIRSAMLEMGKAMMGTGEAEGERRAIDAAEAAINNPLLDDVSMKGAKGVIINITGGYDMTLFEADEACNRIREEVDADANIIFGSTFDETLDGKMRVSVVATGIDAGTAKKNRPVTSSSTSAISNTTNLERARPKTETTTTPVTSFQQHEAAKQTAIDKTKADMYEQHELVEDSSYSQVAARGQRVGDSFIPPAPAQAENFISPSNKGAYSNMQPSVTAAKPMINETSSSQAAALTPNISASRPVSQGSVSTRSNLTLKPPVPGSNKKRTPSLFERITSHIKPEDESHEETSSSSGESSSGGIFSQIRSPMKSEKTSESPSQGRLDVDSPSRAPSKSDDELDIPAFLRRQVN